jgi:2-iminobutanoate/2-iminopropanoate deaminase
MNREVVNPQELPAVNATYSQAIKANGLVFVAGQIGIDPATGKLIGSDIAEQARQAIKNTATILKTAGSSLENVVSTTLYLTEFEHLGKVNAIYAEYFPQAGPAKLSCGVSALYGGAKFEIQVIAVVS